MSWDLTDLPRQTLITPLRDVMNPRLCTSIYKET